VELADRWRPIFADPTQTITAEAEITDGRLTLAVDGPQMTFEVRFLAPARLRDIQSAGAASGVEIAVEDDITVVRLQAGGPFSVTGVQG